MSENPHEEMIQTEVQKECAWGGKDMQT